MGATQSQQTPKDPQRLANYLWTVADATARAHGFEFSQGSEQHMRTLIANGVAVLAKNGYLNDHERVAKSVQDAVRYVEIMVQSSPKLKLAAPAAGTQLLHEDDFVGAQARFCPCFPFC